MMYAADVHSCERRRIPFDLGVPEPGHLGERVFPVHLVVASTKSSMDERQSSTFSCDIAYSERPAASRASWRSGKILHLTIFPSRISRRGLRVSRSLHRWLASGRPCSEDVVPITLLEKSSGAPSKILQVSSKDFQKLSDSIDATVVPA